MAAAGRQPSFSARHPMIPRQYVMPWKRDMKNQRLLKQNADLAGIPVLPHEESPRLCGRRPAASAPLSHTGLPAPPSSHLSRYNSSAVTLRRLYQAGDGLDTTPAPHWVLLHLSPDRLK